MHARQGISVEGGGGSGRHVLPVSTPARCSLCDTRKRGSMEEGVNSRGRCSCKVAVVVGEKFWIEKLNLSGMGLVIKRPNFRAVRGLILVLGKVQRLSGRVFGINCWVFGVCWDFG